MPLPSHRRAPPPPDAAGLRAALEQAYGEARSWYRYATWLRDQGDEARAHAVYRKGEQAFVRGLTLGVTLDALEEANSAPRT